MIAEFWHYFSENRGAVIGLVVFGAARRRRGLRAADRAACCRTRSTATSILLPPSWEEGGSSEFLLGTDQVGRDILSRLLYGARFSLFIGIVVVTPLARRAASSSA